MTVTCHHRAGRATMRASKSAPDNAVYRCLILIIIESGLGLRRRTVAATTLRFVCHLPRLCPECKATPTVPIPAR